MPWMPTPTSTSTGTASCDSILDEIEAAHIATVSVSVDPTSYERCRAIAERCRLIVPTFGIQPWEAPRFVGALDEIASLAATSPMIGEIGLDHTSVADPTSLDQQRVMFGALLDIAGEQRKAVNVHSTGAERETAAMLRSRGLERVIMHWYAGDLEHPRRVDRRWSPIHDRRGRPALATHTRHRREDPRRPAAHRDGQPGWPALAHRTLGPSPSLGHDRTRIGARPGNEPAKGAVPRCCKSPTPPAWRPPSRTVERPDRRPR